jgi:hypothetical protein
MRPIALDAVRAHLDTAIARKRTRPMSSGAYRIQAMVDGLDQIAVAMERKWGVGRLRLLVSDSLRAKFDEKKDRLDAAHPVGRGKLRSHPLRRHEASFVDARCRADRRETGRTRNVGVRAAVNRRRRRSFAPSSKHITSPASAACSPPTRSQS